MTPEQLAEYRLPNDYHKHGFTLSFPDRSRPALEAYIRQVVADHADALAKERLRLSDELDDYKITLELTEVREESERAAKECYQQKFEKRSRMAARLMGYLRDLWREHLRVIDTPGLEVWLCPVHNSLDKHNGLKPLDNCVACIRVERDELRSERDAALAELRELREQLLEAKGEHGSKCASHEKCPDCDGTGNFYGHDEDGDYLPCDPCKGEGYKPCDCFKSRIGGQR